MKATGARDNLERGGKADMLTSKNEMDNMLPSDTTAGHNMTEGIRRTSNSEVVVEEESEGVLGDSIVRKLTQR